MDWLSSMQQTFEYYIVDPITWKETKKIDTVKSSDVSRDSEVDTLGSATIDITESLGECYVRKYLVTIQNGVKRRHPLGTFLVQTPSVSFDGKVQTESLDAYTPLLELKENPPPLGYSVSKGTNILEAAYKIIRENCRTPVVETKNDTTLYYDFVSNTDDTWLTFVQDLLANASYKLGLDEMSRIIFLPDQDIESLNPVWFYNDGNSSILYPDISIEKDLYGIPNAVEVIYTNNNGVYYSKVTNDDIDSPVSTVNRGREILHRIIESDSLGNLPDKDMNARVEEYATQVLKELSTLECTLSYTHGYCPVRIGDCVSLTYKKAGLHNVKAKVISQTIKCEPGCPVTEKAVYPVRLWG